MKLTIAMKMVLLMLIVVITVGAVGVLSVSEMYAQKAVSLQAQEDAIRSDYDQNVQQQVENAISLLQAVYDKAQAGEYTMEEAELLGASLLRGLEYGESGYFWADTYDGTNVVLLGGATEGTNRYDFEDANGDKIVQTIIKVGRQPEGGFTDYVFPKPNETEPLPKRAYSKAFEPFGWVVGTGNYTDYIDNYITEQNATIEAGLSASITRMFLLVGACLLASLLLSVYIALSVVRPLKKLNRITDHLANGNLDMEVDIHTKDEVGKLAESMRSLVSRLKIYIVYINEISDLLGEMGNGNLNLTFKQTYDGDFRIIKDALVNTSDMLSGTLSEFKIAANQVASGSGQVSSGAQALAQGTVEQASSIEELSSSIQEIATQVKENSQSSEQAMALALRAKEDVEQGSTQMKNMLHAMDSIASSSDEIGKIIKVIDDIAFQTNILALNAAVEAARAGAAGKGFAVVADEVRNLASKSAEAAKNSNILIADSLVNVQNGSGIAKATAESLARIAESTQTTTELIKKISSASADQTMGIEQINVGMEQISKVVQTNSASAEESAAAAEELSGQADVLRREVEKFKLKEE